jgi:hypothetical protein
MPEFAVFAPGWWEGRILDRCTLASEALEYMGNSLSAYRRPIQRSATKSVTLDCQAMENFYDSGGRAVPTKLAALGLPLAFTFSSRNRSRVLVHEPGKDDSRRASPVF